MQLPRLVAIDSNVLLRLGDGVEEAVDAWQAIKARIHQVQFLVPSTVIAETVDKMRHDPEAAVRRAAERVLKEIRSRWDFHPASPTAAQDAIIRNAARQLHYAGLIACEAVNDALILAEAAALDCFLLVSNDSHLRDIDPEKPRAVLDPLDLQIPAIRTPREIVRRSFR